MLLSPYVANIGREIFNYYSNSEIKGLMKWRDSTSVFMIISGELGTLIACTHREYVFDRSLDLPILIVSAVSIVGGLIVYGINRIFIRQFTGRMTARDAKHCLQ